MDLAKILANSPTAMTKEAVHSCFPHLKTLGYTENGLSVCCQLGLAEETKLGFVGSDNSRSDVKKATKNQLFTLFQQRIMNYPPFLLYIDFGSKGYSSLDSAARTKGILQMRGSLPIVESSLRRWGVYAQLLNYNKSKDEIMVKVTVERLSAEYVHRLLRAMEAELKIKLFLIDMLGPDVFAYLDTKDIKLDNLSDALGTFESDPRSAATKSTLTLENFLFKLGEDVGVSVSKANGVIELVDRLKGADKILLKHQQIGYGLGAIRNMCSHDPEKDTGKSWTITQAGGLLTTLSVPVAIRSMYLYHTEKKQEF